MLDAALQYQPYMFSRGFVTHIIDPASSGNPAAIAGSVTGAGHVLLHAAALFNAVFATIQLAIGLGLLWRPAVKAALAATIAWGLAVWLLGEGLGGILTGSGSPLTGAPGAAVLYVLLAALIWPRHPPSERPTAQNQTAAGPAASITAASRLGPLWPRISWLLLWASSAYFLLQAQVRAPGGLRSAIAAMAAGEPGWLASLDRSVASTAGSAGGVISAVLAITFLLIGLASSHPRSDPPRPDPGHPHRHRHLGTHREPGRHPHRHRHRPEHRTPAHPASRRLLAARAATPETAETPPASAVTGQPATSTPATQ